MSKEPHLFEWTQLGDLGKPVSNYDPTETHPTGLAPKGIEEAIDESRELMAYPANYDGYGGKPCTPGTWTRAIKYLRRHARLLQDAHSLTLEPPMISLSPDGGIVFYWSDSLFDLEIRVHQKGRVKSVGWSSRQPQPFKSESDAKEYDRALVSWIAFHAR